VDMKVQVYSKFSKNNLKKNKISMLHEGGKISPSQVSRQGSKVWRGNSQRAFLKILYSYCPPFWADVVNSCWLALAHACPTHTSPQNFKHP
jgi:hypothetical protein